MAASVALPSFGLPKFGAFRAAFESEARFRKDAAALFDSLFANIPGVQFREY